MGCGGSKSKIATPAAQPQPAAENKDSVLAPTEQKAEEPKVEEAKAEVPVGETVQIKIASAHGLRAADHCCKKSDVCVEVGIEGKPESTIKTTVVVGKAALRLGAAEGEKASVEVELNFAGEIKNFVAGDKLVFTVKDKDLLTSDILGKAVVTDGSFGGRLDLEGAGDGYTAFLMVQIGEGSSMSAAIGVMKDAAEKAKQALEAAIGAQNVKAAQEAAEAAKDKVEDLVETVQVQSSGWCGC